MNAMELANRAMAELAPLGDGRGLRAAGRPPQRANAPASAMLTD